jgi:hypothetical protein
LREVINAVVIDNEPDDILGVSTALALKGISTIPVHYKAATDAFKACEGAAQGAPRIIITDIQMREGGAIPSRTDLGNVTQCLAKIVSNLSGPYVILAWTSIPAHFATMKEYVENYFARKNIALPIYFDHICKNECRPDGESYCADTIFTKFNTHMGNHKQIQALMHWEGLVLQAASDAVNALVHEGGADIAKTLHALAQQVAGSNLTGNESFAVNESLLYILKDRLSYLSLEEKSKAIWHEAIGAVPSGTLSIEKKSILNTMLHFDKTVDTTLICPGDIWWVDDHEALMKLMSLPSEASDRYTDFRNDIYNSSAGITGDRMICIEISPACDFSNNRKLFKSLVLGILVPKEHAGKIKQKTEYLLAIPVSIDGSYYTLVLCLRYIMSLSVERMKSLEVRKGSRLAVITKKLRMRESLLQSWIHKIASYNSRIGTVSFH